MTCTRCGKEISFNQWFKPQTDLANNMTLESGLFIDSADITITHWHSLSETDIRVAYGQMLTEAAHSRSQP